MNTPCSTDFPDESDATSVVYAPSSVNQHIHHNSEVNSTVGVPDPYLDPVDPVVQVVQQTTLEPVEDPMDDDVMGSDLENDLDLELGDLEGCGESQGDFTDCVNDLDLSGNEDSPTEDEETYFLDHKNQYAPPPSPVQSNMGI